MNTRDTTPNKGRSGGGGRSGSRGRDGGARGASRDANGGGRSRGGRDNGAARDDDRRGSSRGRGGGRDGGREDFDRYSGGGGGSRGRDYTPERRAPSPWKNEGEPSREELSAMRRIDRERLKVSSPTRSARRGAIEYVDKSVLMSLPPSTVVDLLIKVCKESAAATSQVLGAIKAGGILDNTPGMKGIGGKKGKQSNGYPAGVIVTEPTGPQLEPKEALLRIDRENRERGWMREDLDHHERIIHFKALLKERFNRDCRRAEPDVPGVYVLQDVFKLLG